MGRPKGSKSKKSAEPVKTDSKEAEKAQKAPVVIESNEPEYYNPDEEKGEPINYDEEAEAEEKKDGILTAGPGQKLFESPGGCVHVGPDESFFLFCKEEGVNIRPKRGGSGRNG